MAKKSGKNEGGSLVEIINQYDNFFNLNSKLELYKFIIGVVEKPLIEIILNKTRGNQLEAAKILGINRNTLHSKIKKLGITVEKWKY